MNKITLFFAAITLAFATQAQETYKVLKINKGTDVVYEIPLADFDSITFETRKVVTEHNGHEYVDLGLPSGTLWATCNVGATSPEQYGDYFAWGETLPKEDYSWSTLKYWNNDVRLPTKYTGSDGFSTLDSIDDAAAVNWRGKWRMPTKSDQDELRTQCTWSWTSLNSVNGYEVKGPNGNIIFLPAAGYRINSSLVYTGTYGDYWSSSHGLFDSSYGCYLYFGSSNLGTESYNRFLGYSVRPVCSPQ